MAEPVAELSRLVGEQLFAFTTATAIARDPLPLVDLVASGGGSSGAVAAVVLYGSRLTEETGSSEPDYYLVVDSLRAFHRHLGAALWNAILPPSIYHLRIRTTDGERTCKASVISSHQLRRETSHDAHDLHHLGRFSKPLALLYARDDDAFRMIRDAQVSSLCTLAPHALHTLDRRFTVEEFMLALLGLSYLAEHRIVEPGKVRAILEVNRAHQLEVGRLILAGEGLVADGGRYQQFTAGASRSATQRLIARSRLRDLGRWPKYIATFDGWLDYVQRKLERTSGKRLDLTPRQKRHPLLFGWPILVMLRRQGLLG